MQVRQTLFVLAASALAACGAPPSPNEASEPLVETPVAVSAAAAPEYIGLWAASQELCVEPAWRFSAEEVSTLGEVHCAFTQISRDGDRYAIEAMCTAEAPPAPYVLALDVSQAPRNLTVSGGPWMGSTQLVFCAPLTDQ